MAVETKPKRTYLFADFELDATRRRLFRQGTPVNLNSKALDLLLVLVENRNEIVERSHLLNAVWPEQFVEEGNLSVQISTLRKLLGEKKNENNFIATVPGRGYSFVADVRDPADNEIVIERVRHSEFVLEEEIYDSEIAAADYAETKIEVKPTKPAWLMQNRGKLILLTLGIFAVIGFGGYLLMRQFFAKEASSLFANMSIRRLTDKGNVDRAAISPDGKFFAYSYSIGDQETIWLGHVDGGEPIEIHAPVSKIFWTLAFSPDGGSLYFSESDNQGPGILYRVPVLGGVPEKIHESVRHVCLSPDGTQIAFLRYSAESNHLALIKANISDGEEREIAGMAGGADSDWHVPAWSPDGRQIAIAVTSNDDNTDHFFIVSVADGSINKLGGQTWTYLAGLSWLPDGSRLVALGSDSDSLSVHLWLISPIDGDAQILSNDLTMFSGGTSVANDNSILTTNGVSQSNIWVASAGKLAEARPITFGSTGQINGWWGLVWTPDNRIIYSGNVGDSMSLLIINPDTGETRAITPNRMFSSYPSLTADGRTLVFQSNRNGRFAVWRSDIDGSNIHQVTMNQTAGQPFVSPDGKWIIYNSRVNTRGELFRISIDGGQPYLLAGRPVGWAQISPDSSRVACEIEVDGKPKLGILSLDNGDILGLLDLPRLANLRLGAHWSNDGTAVYYRDWSSGIWKQNLDGGAPQKIEGLPDEKLFGFGWSPDGKRLAFARGSTTSDVALVTTRKR